MSPLDRLKAWSPHFTRRLEQYPADQDWLEAVQGDRFEMPDLERDWQAFCTEEPVACDRQALGALQHFRRRHAMRVAYREIGGLADVTDSLREMSLLAEFCLHKLCAWIEPGLWERFGLPICEASGQTCRWCVFALGKLGGVELNFHSDIDLIYVFEGSGHCRKNGRDTEISCHEYFNHFFRKLSAALTDKLPDGPLYELDLRLRPEGDSGPLARTYNSLVGYYWSAGQLWERQAWLKARLVAGSSTLAGEVLEELNPFRYPRYPTENLLREIAALKVRTERETLNPWGLSRDIKLGAGGIREIEFQIQAIQLLQGGRNPFLQDRTTLNALSRLQRYGQLEGRVADELEQAYLFLRAVENRLQMREDSREHHLPAETELREALARSMGFEEVEHFEKTIRRHREAVRRDYAGVFHEDSDEHAIQAWLRFLSSGRPEPEVQARINAWFPQSEQASERLRQFILGKRYHVVTREQVVLFRGLAVHFDELMPKLARPLTCLERVGEFASHYGAPKQFFKAATNPYLLNTLFQLFDQSNFAYRLLCQQPGVMDELLQESPRRLKSRADLAGEMRLLPSGEDFSDYLWLYVKAEQVRLTLGVILHGLTPEQTSRAYSELADATLGATLALADPDGLLAVFATGKTRPGDMMLGSDLDLLLVADRKHLHEAIRCAQELIRLLRHNAGQGAMYDVDLRLRPYGKEGPLVTTPEALAHYHASKGAHAWERLSLVRARWVAGSPEIAKATQALQDSLLTGLSEETLRRDLWEVRTKVRKSVPKERVNLKRSRGGLMEIDLLAQWLAVACSEQIGEELRADTAKILRTAGENACLDKESAHELLRHHETMTAIERILRRLEFDGVSTLPIEAEARRVLAHVAGFPSYAALEAALAETMERVRCIYEAVFLPPRPIPITEKVQVLPPSRD